MCAPDNKLFNSGHRIKGVRPLYSVDRLLQVDDLADLAHRLSLPEGWSSSSRVLEERLDVSAVEGIAIVMQDDLRNTYQLAQ